jgi:hypothetical protein
MHACGGGRVVLGRAALAREVALVTGTSARRVWKLLHAHGDDTQAVIAALQQPHRDCTLLYDGQAFASRKALARHLAPLLGRSVGAIMHLFRRHGDDAATIVMRCQADRGRPWRAIVWRERTFRSRRHLARALARVLEHQRSVGQCMHALVASNDDPDAALARLRETPEERRHRHRQCQLANTPPRPPRPCRYCIECGDVLTGCQRVWCSPACKRVGLTRHCAWCGKAFVVANRIPRQHYCTAEHLHRAFAAARATASTFHKNFSAATRRRLADDHHWRCWLCDQPIDPEATFPARASLAVHRVVSLARGGSNHPDNLRPAHFGCVCKAPWLRVHSRLDR